METQSTGLSVTELRVSNFRCLKNIEVPLKHLTLLVGANNAGKTALLDAMNLSLGPSRKVVTGDDIFIDASEIDVPKDRRAIIDVLIRPVDSLGNVVPQFPKGGFWTSHWGDNIAQDGEMSDFVGIRTTISWSVVNQDYQLTRKFMKEWLPFADWVSAEESNSRVSGFHLEPLVFHFLDAKRDIAEDLRQRGSFWRRLTDDLGLSSEDVAVFEGILTDLNSDIVNKSDVLQYVSSRMQELETVLSQEGSMASVSPVARHFRDLTKGVDISFTASGAQDFPLSRHGMGTRSLASLIAFKAHAEWKHKQALESKASVHTILGLEEPEAHLHPQAQRSLFTQIQSMTGQRVVSTHSPYFLSQATLDQIRLFKREGSHSTVGVIDTNDLNPEDKRLLQTKIAQTRGDILFARALLFFEGETEELALPIWAQAYWGRTIHELGFTFLGVGGMHGYYPFVALAEKFGIPWFILSDGEPKAISAIDKVCEKLGYTDHNDCQNVSILPGGADFEKYLIDAGYVAEVSTAIAKVKGDAYVDTFIRKMHGQPRRGNLIRDYSGDLGRQMAILDIMRENKTEMAAEIAYTVLETLDEARRIPTRVKDIFAQILGPVGGNGAE